MTETHELRLKIDAGAAESGLKHFTGVIETVQKAVRALDRGSRVPSGLLQSAGTLGIREIALAV